MVSNPQMNVISLGAFFYGKILALRSIPLPLGWLGQHGGV
nr:MAG TPA: hypothetical protein [Caudoviricetes sp.]